MRFEAGWRERLWDDIERPWDLIVIGGGITGAGILREAARCGLRALLVERADFASGTSSWSSKLVHGGLRYLASGDWRLTLESVRERQALMTAAPGLVQPLDFVLPMYAHTRPGRFAMGTALKIYDLMARRRHSHYLRREAVNWRLPYLRQEDFRGAFVYPDARTDDVRLVLRVLGEAVEDGAAAVNYCGAEKLVRRDGRVTGVRVRDRVLDRTAELHAAAVINATGPWADDLRAQLDGAPRLRPLRGSHFVFDFERLPVAQAVTLFHPRDGRPLFAFPWQGASLFGTTDIDHDGWPDTPARMSDAEADYLVEALTHYFPALGLRREDALCRYAGVRPVVAGGANKPSEESRESAIWSEDGLVTVTGGKLTTYRITALEALRSLDGVLPGVRTMDASAPILAHIPKRDGRDRLGGRHGSDAAAMRRALPASEFRPVGGSVYTWAELRWAARHEAVESLPDLMLRRTRLGLLLPDGGARELDAVGTICRGELGWDAARWTRERDDYLSHWRREHAPV